MPGEGRASMFLPLASDVDARAKRGHDGKSVSHFITYST
jgi:hypothetical protein